MAVTHFALVWGPKIVTGESPGMHMYFATFEAYYDGVYWRRQQKQDPIYPEPILIPFGTVLEFERLDIRWRSDHGVGCNGFSDSDRNKFVIYTERDGMPGLLLPKLTRTLQYDIVSKDLTRVLPEIFLPFPPYGNGTRVSDGFGKIIHYPTTVTTAEQPVLPA